MRENAQIVNFENNPRCHAGGGLFPHVAAIIRSKGRRLEMKQNFDGITITIPGFENYNGRKDIKKCSWLRLENAISTSEAMFGLDAAERYVFVEILCRASEKQQSRVKINVEYLAQRACATAVQVRSAISKLIANGTLELCDQTRPDLIGSVRAEEVITPVRSEVEGSRSDLALTDGRDEQDEPDGTNERDEVSADTKTPTALIEALKPFDPDSKLELTFLKRNVSLETQQALLDAYPDPKWVSQQVFRSLFWEVANPHKKKKNFSRFLGNWLSRGWDEHTSKLPSNPVRTRTGGYQRPAGAHERDDDLDAVIEKIKTDTYAETQNDSVIGVANAAAL